jgi:probable F420-dependent oxidoreductase
MELGRVGIWSSQLRYGDAAVVPDAASELDELGFTALWIPGGAGGDVFGACRALLDAAPRAAVATGILNIWKHGPDETAAGHAELTGAHPGRFLLGLGVSHAALIDADGPGTYQRPYSKMVGYLDAIDRGSCPVPASERVLAALGPRMLTLAADRSLGAHPYNVPPEHTAIARERMGPAALLAPEQAIVLETDPDRARHAARVHLSTYLERLPNYTNNLLQFGYTDDDFVDGGSDRLVDALVAWGDEDAALARIKQHHDAGADHVCVQVVTGDRGAFPFAEWRRLAAALFS